MKLKLRLHCPLRALIFSLFLRDLELAQYQKHFRKKERTLQIKDFLSFLSFDNTHMFNLPKYTVLPDMINVHIKKLSASVDVFYSSRRIFCSLPDKLSWALKSDSFIDFKPSFLLPIGKSEARKGLKSRTHISLKRRMKVWVKDFLNIKIDACCLQAKKIQTLEFTSHFFLWCDPRKTITKRANLTKARN